MEVTTALVDKLANLAKLEFSHEEKGKIQEDLSKIVAFVDKLSELDTSQVEPLIFMSNEVNVLREDEVHQPITQQEALKNAPKRDSDYFKVPKFLDK
jgi:aspartyl-tRNA(Asn)/glutamyl-tRNA(Gln) amidotransferase subunit C